MSYSLRNFCNILIQLNKYGNITSHNFNNTDKYVRQKHINSKYAIRKDKNIWVLVARLHILRR